MVKYTLIDTFNNVVVSRHRTLKAAARADLALNRAVKRHNGLTSYLPTKITRDGENLDDDEHELLCAYLAGYLPVK